MTLKRLAIPLALCLIGCAALAVLFPRLDPAARWGCAIDRGEAIARARAVAARFGVDAEGWAAVVTSSADAETQYYLAHGPDPAAAPLLSPVMISVELVGPRAGQSLDVRFDGRGRLRGFSRQEKIPPPESAPPAEARREAALRAAGELLGGEYRRFTMVSRVDRGAEGSEYLAEDAVPDDPRLRLVVKASLVGTAVKELEFRPDFTARLREERESRRGAVLRGLSVAEVLTIAFVVLAALIFFFVGLVRREVRFRSAFVLLGLAFALLAVGNAFGGVLESLRDQLLDNPSIPNAVLANLLVWVAFLAVGLGMALAVFVVWGAGSALASRKDPGPLVTFEALLGGRLMTRPVGLSLAAGALIGGWVATVPHLVAGSGAFAGAELRASAPAAMLAASAPALASLLSSAALAVFVIFGFLAPLLQVYLPYQNLARLLVFVVGVLWLGGEDYFRTSAGAALAAGAVLALTYELTYRSFGLLAVTAAALSAAACVRAATLLTQPSGTLRSSGLRLLLGLGALLAGALALLWKGRGLDVAAEAEGWAAESRTASLAASRVERERLKAEFGVARRAQEQMLPAAPPALPGYELAAVCRPSREVGGDLYDFIPLGDGRWGIVVADVSGKGVPAALYMTLTKGLLASVAEDSQDPGEILRVVNRHLYEACRRKVFVTLFLGVLDPRAGTLTYARAGHNPPVWRQPGEQRTTLLRPAGLGLGLNAGKAFDRALAVDQIPLGPHDAVLFYSDGITEAMNAQGEEYGEERLMAVAARVDGLGAPAARDAVLADVGAFLGRTPPQDDQTLVVLRAT